MFSEQPYILYSFLDLEYYENIETYQPTDEYLSMVAGIVGEGWTVAPYGFWTRCEPAGQVHLAHGWKIHVSAVPWTAQETLERTVPVLARDRVAFKFTSDARMLQLSLSKNWSRTGAGKFMAIYPNGEEQFVRLIDALHEATREMRGPYVLSDRPYRDSKVIFYRYGEHRSNPQAQPTGQILSRIQGPDGEWFYDDRVPYFRMPPWVKDPFTDAPQLKPPDEKGVLLHDRYRVTKALKFTGVGGIYGGEDTRTGRTVVIREGRPLLGTTRHQSDTLELLHKEARILAKMGSTGLMPQLVELFQEWEHLFLVQERLDAESLWGYSMNFWYRTAETSPAEAFVELRTAFEKIIEGLSVVHRNGIVLRDLTKNNVMFTEAGEVKFIDLEFAYETDRDDPHLWVQTAGYASPDQLRNEKPCFEDDHYALGALLLDVTAYTASGLDLNRTGVLAALEMVVADLRLPREIYDLVHGLTEPDREKRWDLDRALEVLRGAPVPTDRTPLFNPGEVPRRPASTPALRAELEATVGGIARFIHAKTDLARHDRLWPASAEAFVTNPVGFQHGAAGTAFFLLRSEGRVPDQAIGWILGHLDVRPTPPGLNVGHAGVALLLLEAGWTEEAVRLLDRAAESEILHREPGLFYGSAGWGLVQLHFWHRLGERRFLDRAIDAGERLLEAARQTEHGVCWHPVESAVMGLGEGQAGIALFLLYLDALAPRADWLETAVQAVDFEIAHCQDLGNQVLWYPRANSTELEPKSPHLWFGTAGIGAVLVRAWAASGEQRLRSFAQRCAATLCERFTNKIWIDFGLAGFGELLIDMYQFTGDEQFLCNAFHLSEAILPHRIEKDGGYAICGQDLYRICCDYGQGSAGIGIHLHRLLHPATPRLLMLDALLPTAIDLTPPAIPAAAAALAPMEVPA